MIDTLQGTIQSIRENAIVVTVGGFGLRVHLTERDLHSVERGEEVFLHTAFVVREDAFSLYGFLDEMSLLLFEMLTTVSTIGPKVAMTILSHAGVEALSHAVQTEDIPFLTTIPGVGKKTAGRLVLELADKLDGFVSVPDSSQPTAIRETENAAIALDALLNLGFVRKEVEDVLHSMQLGQMSIEEIVKESLRKLS